MEREARYLRERQAAEAEQSAAIAGKHCKIPDARDRISKEQDGPAQQAHPDNIRVKLRGRAPRPRSAV